MKKPLLVLAALLGLAGPVYAQGTIPVAMNIQQDINGRPLAGALLYLYVVGTTATPQIAYQDVNLTPALALPWPVKADQVGRLPMFYLAAGSVHVRLTDASGNVQFDYPNVLVIGGASGGGGGGPTVDPSSIASTGDIKFRPTAETLSGWVVLNGQTIGNATSGASQIASAATQNLFTYLWTNCDNTHCPVTPGGRGVSGLADFNANKQIQLFDLRSRTPVGRDCMGSSPCAGRLLLSNVTSGGSDGVDTAIASGGAANQAIAQTYLPNITLSVNIGAGQGNHAHGTASYFTGSTSGGGPGLTTSSTVLTATSGTSAATLPGMSGTAPLGGSGTLFPMMSPFMLGTWYQKL